MLLPLLLSPCVFADSTLFLCELRVCRAAALQGDLATTKGSI